MKCKNVALWLFNSLVLSFCRSAIGDTIAFFYALDSDYKAFTSTVNGLVSYNEFSGAKIAVIKVGTHQVVASKMGSGNVSTAQNAQSVLGHYNCQLVISIGPAGSLSQNIKPSQWYIVREVVGYQVGSTYPTGFVQKSSARQRAASEIFPPKVIPKPFSNAESILVASGETFIASDMERQRLHSQTKADAVDMNLYGLSEVCLKNKIPWVAWKIISDNADDTSSQTFEKFLKDYAGAGGKAVALLVMNLPPSKSSFEAYPTLNRVLKE